MGIVFGVTGTQEPPFTLLSSPQNYQVRVYSPYLIAEVPQLPGQEGNSFTILAKYIGVFGKPETPNTIPMVEIGYYKKTRLLAGI